MGPSSLIGLPNSIALIIVGLFITGVGSAFTTVGTYQEMYIPFVALNGGEAAPRYDKDKLGDILSGLYNGGYSIGVIIGPLTSSYLTILLDNSFQKSSDMFAFITIGFGTLLLLVVGIPNILRRRRAAKS